MPGSLNPHGFRVLFIWCLRPFARHSPGFTILRYMRDTYYDELDAVVDELVAMTAAVREALRTATEALVNADGDKAESVIAADKEIDEARQIIEERALLLLATQQPVATDLRQLVATLRMVADLERMGDLSVHIAKVARMRLPGVAVPASVRPIVDTMAEVADRMIESASRIVADRDVDAAAELEIEDDLMDGAHRALFRELLGDEWNHGVEPAIDMALIGRYYERIGDHAVSVARRVVFLVTGETRFS